MRHAQGWAGEPEKGKPWQRAVRGGQGEREGGGGIRAREELRKGEREGKRKRGGRGRE